VERQIEVMGNLTHYADEFITMFCMQCIALKDIHSLDFTWEREIMQVKSCLKGIPSVFGYSKVSIIRSASKFLLVLSSFSLPPAFIFRSIAIVQII
jgi:hypothetical protein